MTGPQDPAGASGDRIRVGHADREQAVERLKDAFVQGRLARDELDTRAGRALTARTRADLAALTADIPSGPAAARPECTPAPARRRPLARAAAKSGTCLVVAAAAVWAAFILDPGPQGPQQHGSSGVGWCFVLALYAVLAALGFLAHGAATSREQRRSRRPPPRTGPGGRALEAGQSSGIGHGPVPPGPRIDQTRADLRSDSSRPPRSQSCGRAARRPRGLRPVPDAV